MRKTLALILVVIIALLALGMALLFALIQSGA